MIEGNIKVSLHFGTIPSSPILRGGWHERCDYKDKTYFNAITCENLTPLQEKDATICAEATQAPPGRWELSATAD